MKQQLKILLKIKTLCVMFFLLLTGCEKDDNIIIDNQNSQDFIVKRLNKHELDQNYFISEKLNKINNRNKSNSLSRENNNPIFDFTVYAESAIYIEDNERHSYTFNMYSEWAELNTLQNFVLSSRNDGTYQASIYEYQLQDYNGDEIILGSHISTYTRYILPDDLEFNNNILSISNDNPCIAKYYTSSTYSGYLTEDDCENLPDNSQPCVFHHQVENHDCDENPQFTDDADGGGGSFVYIDVVVVGNGPQNGTDYTEWNPTTNGPSGNGNSNTNNNNDYNADTTPVSVPIHIQLKQKLGIGVTIGGVDFDADTVSNWIENLSNISEVIALNNYLSKNIAQNGYLLPVVRDFVVKLILLASEQENNELISIAIENLRSFDENNYPGKENGFPFNWWYDEDFIEENIVLDIDDEGISDLTDAENILVALFPVHALIIKANVDVAQTETYNRFGVNGRNDKSDSFRHAFFNAMNSNDAGDTVARLFSKAHESEVPANLILEVQMDLYNNDVGHTIGNNASIFVSDQILSNSIYAALLAGDLFYLSPLDTVVPPNFGINSDTQLTPTNQ